MSLLVAEQLQFAPAGGALRRGLSFAIGPGLSLVCGGEGSGKSTLLKLMAGELAPSGGSLRRLAGSCFHQTPADERHDPVIATAWLEALRARYPAWQARLLPDLAEALGLTAHLHKPMFMLSTGRRRKLGLLGAVASGAELCLLDSPYAALGARSCRVLTECLAQAATSARQAWVLADHGWPAGLASMHPATHVDLDA